MSAEEFAKALAAFQQDMPQVGKGKTAQVKSDKGNYSYGYADLSDIVAVAMPLLAKQGLSFTASPTLDDAGHFVLRYALLHEAGHREGGDFPLPDPARFSSQQIGSALTYARRYSFTAVTGIAPGGEDDDGQRAADARSSEIAVRDPGRSRNRTTRRSETNDAPNDDPWTAPVERATDVAWFTGLQERLTLAGNPAEVRGLVEEARGQWQAGKLSDADAATWKQLSDDRMSELTGVAV